MRIKNTYFSFLFILSTFLSVIIPSSIFAQNIATTKLGVSWGFPNTPSEISSDLKMYQDLGVVYLELRHPVDRTILDSLSSYDFEVWVRFENEFLTTSELQNSSQGLTQNYSSRILEYSKYEFITAFGLYSNSQSYDSDFNKAFNVIETELRKITELTFYEASTKKTHGLDFPLTEVTNNPISVWVAFYNLSKTYEKSDFYLLETMFDLSSQAVFLNSFWLENALKDYPPLRTTLLEFKKTGHFVLPLPKKEHPYNTFNWPIVVFILLWLSFGIHIRVSATYKPLITRFFTGHRFFVDDIMRYRERSALSGVFLFFQHAILTGLVTYIVSQLLISEVGMKALFEIVPQLAVTGQNYFSLFVFGTLLSCFVQLIGLAWLYFPSKSMTHFSQVLNLYTWVFHIDFLLVSVMLVLLITGSSPFLILVLGSFFIINWLIAYFLACYDSSKYLMRNRTKYILYTFGLHTLVNIILLILILSSQSLLDTLDLIISV